MAISDQELRNEWINQTGRRGNNSLFDIFTSIPLSDGTQQAAPAVNKSYIPNLSNLTDYIPSISSVGKYIPTSLPDVFSQRNPAYEGLLGPEQSQALSQRSNISGLLGAAAALAQGMGRQGGRRSATQNILSALGAGYGASGQAYNQGLQSLSAAQQLQANTEKQKAFADMAIKYPDLAPLARIDPAKFVEMVSQLEQQRPITEAYKQAQQQPVQQVAPPVRTQADIAYENQLAAVEQDRNLIQQQNAAREQEYLKTLGVSDVANKDIFGQPVALAASAVPREGGDPQAGTAQPIGAELSPVPFAGLKADIAKLDQAPLPAIPERPVPVVQPAPQVNLQEKALRDQKDTLIRVNANLSRLGTTAANNEVKNNLEQIKSLDTQIQQYAVGSFDFDKIRSSIPKEYRSRVDLVEQMAKKNMLSGNEVRIGVQEAVNAAQNKTADIQEYRAAQNDPIKPFKGSFQDWVQFAGGARRTQLNVNTGELSKPTKTKLEEELLTTGNAASRLAQIQSTFRPEYLNIKFRGQQEWASLKDKFVNLDPKEKTVLQAYSVYRQNSTNNLNQTIKDLTGSAMGVDEAKRIIAGAPSAGTGVFDGDSPSTFEAKLNNQIKSIQYALARKQYSLKRGLNWEATPLEKMPDIVNQRGKEIAEQFKLNPQNQKDLNTINRQLAAEFGVSF
jgi:hypothetical protein